MPSDPLAYAFQPNSAHSEFLPKNKVSCQSVKFICSHKKMKSSLTLRRNYRAECMHVIYSKCSIHCWTLLRTTRQWQKRNFVIHQPLMFTKLSPKCSSEYQLFQLKRLKRNLFHNVLDSSARLFIWTPITLDLALIYCKICISLCTFSTLNSNAAQKLLLLEDSLFTRFTGAFSFH